MHFMNEGFKSDKNCYEKVKWNNKQNNPCPVVGTFLFNIITNK